VKASSRLRPGWLLLSSEAFWYHHSIEGSVHAIHVPDFFYHYSILKHTGRMQAVRYTAIDCRTWNTHGDSCHLCCCDSWGCGGCGGSIFTPSPSYSQTLAFHVEPIGPCFCCSLRRYAVFEVYKCASENGDYDEMDTDTGEGYEYTLILRRELLSAVMWDQHPVVT
jgi:hypothetical protein